MSQTLLRFLQVETGPTDDDIRLMLDVVNDHLADRQLFWSSVFKRQHVDAKRRLQWRFSEHLVDDNIFLNSPFSDP